MSYTHLNDRTLWYDGDSTVSQVELFRLASSGYSMRKVFVEQMTEHVKQYNNFVDQSEQITVKQCLNPLNYDWNIPQSYKQMNVEQYIIDKLTQECEQLQQDQIQQRERRVANELALYKENQLYDVLRVLIYIINKFETHGIVWGVGRGSSVSSYVLYLIGVHDIDSVFFELEIEDFIKDQD